MKSESAGGVKAYNYFDGDSHSSIYYVPKTAGQGPDVIGIAQTAETNDLVSNSFASFTPAVGLEFGYIDLVFVRAGVGNFQSITQLDGNNSLGFQPNIGIGFKYKGIQVDYALTDLGDQSAALYSNIFSITLDWSLFR